jgi:hypothetical protein
MMWGTYYPFRSPCQASLGLFCFPNFRILLFPGSRQANRPLLETIFTFAFPLFSHQERFYPSGRPAACPQRESSWSVECIRFGHELFSLAIPPLSRGEKIGKSFGGGFKMRSHFRLSDEKPF